jgi:hypothetical protein
MTSMAARSTPTTSPTSGASAPIGPPSWATEHLDELVELLVGHLVVHVHAEPPVPVRHDLRRVGDQGHPTACGAVPVLDVAVTDVEGQGHPEVR